MLFREQWFGVHSDGTERWQERRSRAGGERRLCWFTAGGRSDDQCNSCGNSDRGYRVPRECPGFVEAFADLSATGKKAEPLLPDVCAAGQPRWLPATEYTKWKNDWRGGYS